MLKGAKLTLRAVLDKEMGCYRGDRYRWTLSYIPKSRMEEGFASLSVEGVVQNPVLGVVACKSISYSLKD